MTPESCTVAELFAIACDAIPHHSRFRDLWTGRVVSFDEYPRYVCPKCGRRLPVNKVALGMGAGGAYGGAWTLTDTEVAMKCAVCGFDHKLAIPMSLVELDAGARRLVTQLDEQGWDRWHDVLLDATEKRDLSEQAEAIGQTLLLIQMSLVWLRPHAERDHSLHVLAISSALHWPHRA
ncbi:MAG: hypothetical protein U0W40_08570 [Acidimicrobiia bacterium]